MNATHPPGSLDLLTDQRTGIVGLPAAGPGPWPIPGIVTRYRATVHIPGSRRPLSAVGAALGGPLAARTACVAEAAERYCAARRAGNSTWSSTGCAAGPTNETATASACWELLERHQLSSIWYGGGPLPTFAPPDHWRRHLAGAGIEMWASLLPGAVPAVLVVLHAADRQLLGAGAAARSTIGAAVDKAVCEAVVSLAGAAELADPESPVLIEAVAGGLLRPWRQDRRYLNSYRSDLADVTDLACHAQLLLDPALQQRVLDRLDRSRSAEVADGGPPAATGALAPPNSSAANLEAHRFLKETADLVVTDLTTPDVSLAGLRVVQATADGLLDLAPAASAPDADPVPLT